MVSFPSRYIVYSYKFTHKDGRSSFPLVFLYYTPPSSTQLSMLYAFLCWFLVYASIICSTHCRTLHAATKLFCSNIFGSNLCDSVLVWVTFDSFLWQYFLLIRYASTKQRLVQELGVSKVYFYYALRHCLMLWQTRTEILHLLSCAALYFAFCSECFFIRTLKFGMHRTSARNGSSRNSICLNRWSSQ